MNDYWQPDFYRFSQDSVELAKFVIQEIKMLNFSSIVDLCSGCGIVGIEIVKSCPSLKQLISYEKSELFKSYAQKNYLMLTDVDVQDHFNKLDSFINCSNKFECIVANPPYYLVHETRPSLDINRDQAMRWASEDEFNFVKCFMSLKMGHRGFFLSRKELSYWKSQYAHHFTHLKFEIGKKLSGANIITVTYIE